MSFLKGRDGCTFVLSMMACGSLSKVTQSFKILFKYVLENVKSAELYESELKCQFFTSELDKASLTLKNIYMIK